jgi:hypothetical protein
MLALSRRASWRAELDRAVLVKRVIECLSFHGAVCEREAQRLIDQ